MHGLQWYVIFCKPHQETRVCHYLGLKGLETYFPTYPVQNDSSARPQFKPLFPRYLFVRADLDATGISLMNWVPGVVGLVTYGDTPASIPQNIITELKNRTLESSSTCTRSPCDQIRRGQPVRILQGPFAGYEAIFDSSLSGSQRVRVFLHLLSRQVKITINSNAIDTLTHPHR
jgi:transcription elongation factor/antiterminator RfaH